MFETPPMSTESFVNSFDSSTTTATPMASPIPDTNKPVPIPKYLELVYDENDMPPSSHAETELSSSKQLPQQQTPYEIPINLNDIDAKHSQIENHSHNNHNIPVESSNCSSISGDEGSMQALLGLAPPPPTNDPTNT